MKVLHRESAGVGRDSAASATESVPRGGTSGFTENLEHAASGDANAQRRMNPALQTATLRDGRYRKQPLDLERAQRRHDGLRAAERYLKALNRYRHGLDNLRGRCDRP
jgi:hypothetical protein